jgi:hypothetical protein
MKYSIDVFHFLRNRNQSFNDTFLFDRVALRISLSEFNIFIFELLTISKRGRNHFTFSFLLASKPTFDVDANAKWINKGITVAGGHAPGEGLNQLYSPQGLYVDEDQTVVIADCWKDRIVEWKFGATSRQVVAGGNGRGTRNDQLNYPRDVIVDSEKDSLIICDQGNRRVVRWPRRGGTSGQTVIDNVACWGLTMDDDGFLYVCDSEKHEVRRWRVEETSGALVAGGNGGGQRLNQLNSPQFVFVDGDHSVYVSDHNNHRVMKWMKGAKEGIVVAGGQGEGDALTQLYGPGGVIVDQLGTVYVADFFTARVMRWCKGAKEGSIVVGGNGYGKQANQLNAPMGLSFDRHGNLYVSDMGNGRVQKVSIV